MLSATFVFNATPSAAWTAGGAGATHHARLVDADDGTYIRSIGIASGTEKLGITGAEVGPADMYRIRHIVLTPLRFAGTPAINYPVLKMELVVNGLVISWRQYDADSAGDFVDGVVTFYNVNYPAYRWQNASSRELWLTCRATPTNIREEEPFPQG